MPRVLDVLRFYYGLRKAINKPTTQELTQEKVLQCSNIETLHFI